MWGKILVQCVITDIDEERQVISVHSFIIDRRKACSDIELPCGRLSEISRIYILLAKLEGNSIAE